MTKYIILVLCICSISLGQILFKLSANNLKQMSSVFALCFEPTFILACSLYAVTTFGWVWALQEIPLSRAYLFMALAFVMVPAMGFLFFGEALTTKYFISAALIVAGVVFSGL